MKTEDCGTKHREERSEARKRTEQKEIQTYCERVMEEVEEELQMLLYEEKLNETT